MADNIILIGFMAVGKGRTARALAEQTGLCAVDTDDMIESMVKKKVRKLFAQQGEAAFRLLEQKIADWLEYHVCKTVVSTGGGFFKVKNINRLGRVVYLHSPVEDIYKTLCQQPKAKKKIKKRPLLTDLKQAEQLFQERLPQYRQVADVEIVVTGKTSLEVADEITDYLQTSLE